MVAAELLSEGAKDVVIYKIRVADASGEWTVSRRFRNFETLHRALRELSAYRLRLPAKRIFSQQHSVEFVEDRRQQLDTYLSGLLANPAVAGAHAFCDLHKLFGDTCLGVGLCRRLHGPSAASLKRWQTDIAASKVSCISLHDTCKM